MFDLFRLPEPTARVPYSRVSTGTGTIFSQRKLTHDTFEIIISCDGEFSLVDAEAGQFVVLGFPGIDRPRPYSLAKNPRSSAPGKLTFFIRVVPNGEVSTWLREANRTGSKIKITGPLGSFTLDDTKDPMVCIAGGSGMSAIMALVEYATDLQVDRDCYFYYGARSQADLYCRKEIERAQELWNKNRELFFVPVLSEEPITSKWQGARGLVTDVFLKEISRESKVDLKTVSSFLCGPPPMIKAAVAMLKRAGTPPEKIFEDKFEDARSPAPIIDNHRCVLCDECLLVTPVEGCIVETAGLNLRNSDKVLSYRTVEPSHTSGLYYNSLYIDESNCIRCFACVNVCPHGAISTEHSITGTLRQKAYELL